MIGPSFRSILPSALVVAVAMLAGAWVFSAFPLGAHTSAWGITLLIIIIVGAIALLLMFQFRQEWRQPTRLLTSAAQRMSGGDWKSRVQPDGPDELRELAGALNDIADQARRQFKELRHQRSDLASLVDSLPDPILLTDPQGHVAQISEPCARLLGLSVGEVVGHMASEVITEPMIRELFYEIASPEFRTGSTVRRELHLLRTGQHFVYQALAGRTLGGGVVIIMRDITELAAAVQMKTDFVANASHELRTPIAAIKIAIDTMREVKDEDPKLVDRCAEIVQAHLKRLEDLMQDLLDLSRVESADLQVDPVAVSIGELFAALRTTMSPLAESKEVTLAFTGDESASLVTDRRMVDLILKNLLENSVKYTLAGGKVTLAFESTATANQFKVIDTGIGIPPEHLERVFERFYQVDSARSGSSGRGTGLGLAIVKHATSALGGTIQLQSQAGKGTTATLELPK